MCCSSACTKCVRNIKVFVKTSVSSVIFLKTLNGKLNTSSTTMGATQTDNAAMAATSQLLPIRLKYAIRY